MFESFPESLHDNSGNTGYISHFEDNPTQANSFTRGKYTVLFENALKEMGDETNPTDDWERELILRGSIRHLMIYRMDWSVNMNILLIL